MTAETRSSVPESIEKATVEEALFELALQHLNANINKDKRPANIVMGIEAYPLSFKLKITIVKNEDSIAMMVGGHLKRIYSAELDSVEPEQTGMPLFLRTLINLALRKSPQT
jgi:hypothetical protein